MKQIEEEQSNRLAKKTSELPKVEVESVPTNLQAALDALLRKHAPLWEGILGLIEGTEQRIR